MNKTLIQSKTFWSNVVMAVLPLFPSVNEAVVGNPALLVAGFAVINIVLRLISKDKVSLA